MNKEILKVIGQLQYEISLLEHSKEELTGVTNRTEELKELVKKLTIPVVSNQRELLLDEMEKWLFLNTKLDVTDIVDFKLRFKQ